MSVPGIDATVALSIVAAVGDFTRFGTPEKLVAYPGLNPRVRQSGGQPARHGRITKTGAAHAPGGMLVEAAWSPVQGSRSIAGVLPAGASPARDADRCGGHRPQTCRAVLASDHQRVRTTPSLSRLWSRTNDASSSCVPGVPPRVGARAPHRDTRLEQSAPPSASWPRKPKPPTAPSSPPGNRANPPPPPGQTGTAPEGRRWAWLPPTGRDYSVPHRATQRGRANSPLTLLLATRSNHAQRRPTLRRSSPGSRSFVQPGAPPNGSGSGPTC
jgi:hypothetical protein